MPDYIENISTEEYIRKYGVTDPTLLEWADGNAELQDIKEKFFDAIPQDGRLLELEHYVRRMLDNDNFGDFQTILLMIEEKEQELNLVNKNLRELTED